MADFRDLVRNPGYIAASTISKKRLIEITTYPNVQHASADTDTPEGVSLSDAATGETVEYERINGQTTTLTASGAISAGAKIAPDAAGKVKAAASADEAIGKAMVAADEDGDEIPCRLNTLGLLA